MRYEWGRAKRALLGFAPVLLVASAAAALSHRPMAAATCGLVTFAAGATILWYGRDLKRTVLLGAVAGLVPLLLSLCSAHMGRWCNGGDWMMVCVPACVLGGLVAGLAVANVASRRRASVRFWVAASALALLTGTMGCTCAGVSGVFGLAIGYLAGIVPGLVGRAFATKRRMR
jgi:hypothetical protein